MSNDLKLDVNINVNNSAGNEINKVASQADKAFKGTAIEQRKAEAGLRSYSKQVDRTAAAQQAAAYVARGGSALAETGLGKQKQAAQGAANALDKTAEAGKRAQSSLDKMDKSDFSRLNQNLSRARQSLLGIGQTAKDVLKGIGQVGTGMVAMGMVGARAIAKPVDFEKALTSLAITAYGDKGDAAFNAGYAALRAGVDNAVRTGGGSREEAVQAAQKLMASGIMEADDIISIMPLIQKAATASGTSSEDIAGIIVAGVQNRYFGANKEDVAKALDIAVMGGKLGAAELNNMAASMPMLMASSQGHRGLEGFASLIASFETAMSTSGSADQAATNLNALYAKLTSAEMNRAFKEKYNIDLAGSLAASREKGVSPMDAFLTILDKEVVSKNTQYQALQARLKDASDADKRAILEQMGDIIQASAVGEVLPDIRASRALAAHLSMRDYRDNVYKELLANSEGVVDTDHRYAMNTTAAKIQAAANEKEVAQSAMLDDIKGPLDSFLSGTTALAREFPRLATLVTETATSFSMLLAGGAAVAGFGMLFWRRGGGGGKPGMPGMAGMAGGGLMSAAGAGVVPVFVTNMGGNTAMNTAGGAADGAAGGSRAGGRAGGRFAAAGRFMRGAGPLALAFGAYNAFDIASDSSLSDEEKLKAQVGNAGATAGSLGGVASGALIGTAIFPGLGTVVGGILGGIMGGWLGDKAATGLLESQQQTIELALQSTLNLDGRVIAEEVAQFQALQLSRTGM